MEATRGRNEKVLLCSSASERAGSRGNGSFCVMLDAVSSSEMLGCSRRHCTTCSKISRHSSQSGQKWQRSLLGQYCAYFAWAPDALQRLHFNCPDSQDSTCSKTFAALPFNFCCAAPGGGGDPCVPANAMLRKGTAPSLPHAVWILALVEEA